MTYITVLRFIEFRCVLTSVCSKAVSVSACSTINFYLHYTIQDVNEKQNSRVDRQKYIHTVGMSERIFYE